MDKPICINCRWCNVPSYTTPAGVVEPHPQYAKCGNTNRSRIDLVTGELLNEWKYCKDNRSITGFCGPDGRHFNAKETVNG